MTDDRPRLSETLRGVVVRLRGDLDVSRHRFRDGAAYVVRDPITFATTKIDAGDYPILTRLGGELTLGQVFGSLVDDGVLRAADEEAFYEFVVGLHRDGLLSLPVNDPGVLYERFERRRRRAARSRFAGFLFMRVPLVNPDRFLDRTAWLFRPLFTRTAFALWMVLMACAAALAVSRWGELVSPLLTMLSGDRVALLWLTLVGLKVVHEFGHSYACKVFGGHVPEMGAFLILFTPCAYMDATDSWRFSSRTRRVVVALGGVYFESIVGAVALFVWAFTGPSTLNTVAYQVVLLSTLVTVAFNLNPLMKFDGYFVASDVSGVPNLRARAQGRVRAILKRVALGITTEDGASARSRAALAAYGVALLVYRFAMVVSICAVIASKFYLVGLGLAAFFLATTFGGGAVRLFRYLWASPETRGVRARAIAVSAALLVGLPAALLMVPVRPAHAVWGSVGHERDTVVRAVTPGFVRSIDVEPGDVVLPGRRVATLEGVDGGHGVGVAAAALSLAETRVRRAFVSNGSLDAPALGALDRARAELRAAEESAAALEPTAPHAGVVVAVAPDGPGRFLERGDPIAHILGGAWRASFYVEESTLDETGVAVGDRIACVPVVDPTGRVAGVVAAIEPSAHRGDVAASLTSAHGGGIEVDPSTGVPVVALVRVTVDLDASPLLRNGSTLRWRLRGAPRPLAAHIGRRLSLFMNRLKVEQS